MLPSRIQHNDDVVPIHPDLQVLPEIDKTLKKLHGTNALKTKLQDKLRNFKTEVNRIQARVQSLRNTLFDLLQEDQDLALMNLTQVQHDWNEGSLDFDVDHDEVSTF